MMRSMRIVAVLALAFGLGVQPRAIAQQSDEIRWGGMSLEQLSARAEQLLADGTQTQQLASLTAHAEQRFEKAAPAEDFDVRPWLPLACAIGDRMAGASRKALGQAIQQQLAKDDASFGKLEGTVAAQVCHALRAAGLADVAWARAVAWIGGSERYKELAAPEVARFSIAMRAAGDEGSAQRQRLVRWVEANLLASAQKVRGMRGVHWRMTVQGLRAELDDAAADRWVGKIAEAFAASPLSERQFEGLTEAIRRLNQDRAVPFATAWVEKCDAWQNWPGRSMVGLVGRLGTPKQAPAARKRIAEHVTGKILPDAATVRGIDCVAWGTLSRHLSAALSVAQKKQWADGLAAAFGEVALDERDGRALILLHRQLTGGKGAGFADTWLVQHDHWRSWDPDNVLFLAGYISKTPGGLRARRRLIEFTSTLCAAGRERVAKVAAFNLYLVTNHLRKDLTDSEKLGWRKALREAFVDQPLKAGDLGYLRRALASLDDREEPTFSALWAAGNDLWRKWQPVDVLRLAGDLGTAESAQPVRRTLGAYLLKSVLDDAATVASVHPYTLAVAARTLQKDLTEAQRLRWLAGLKSAFKDKPLSAKYVSALSSAAKSLAGEAGADFA